MQLQNAQIMAVLWHIHGKFVGWQREFKGGSSLFLFLFV